MSQRLGNALMVVGIVVAAALVSAGPPLGVDYPGPSWVGVDAASPSIEALVGGHLHRFFAEQPMQGPLSLLVRAPFAALAGLDHPNLLLEYRLGVFPCVLALAALGLVVFRRMERDGRPWTARVLVLALIVAGPTTFKALEWGHPEELLATALAVGAILAAPRRAPLAGLLFGLALATKQWALLAFVPVLATATEQRLKLLTIAAVTCAVLYAPMAIGDFHRFWAQNVMASGAGPGVTPSTIWWPFEHVSGVQHESGKVILSHAIPAWMTAIAEPLVIVLAAVLSAAYWRRRARHDATDALGLFALIMLIRCMLDPMSISYHHGTFLVALAAYEAQSARRLPYMTLVASGGLLITAQLASAPDALNAVYLAWTVPMTLILAFSLFGKGRLGARLRLRPLPAAA